MLFILLLNNITMKNYTKTHMSNSCFFSLNIVNLSLWSFEDVSKIFMKGINLAVLSFHQIFIASLLKIVCILIAVAYFTIAERKVMAAIQRRKGPNVVGFWGLLQPLADGAKLMFKELLIPTRANATIFLVAPVMVLILSII